MKFLKNVKHAHFIGIGGIGVSALAKLYHHYGIEITGSDLVPSEITEELSKNYDIPIFIGSNAGVIDKHIDMVVYSPAVPKTDPEYKKARLLNIPTFSYPEILGKISQEKYTIAIAGTNGKTTTTTMLVEAMKDQGVNPTVIVGGVMQKYQTNILIGNSPYFITEACEYRRSFLHIFHNVVAITNITEDHLDYFRDLADIQKAFQEFMNKTKKQGILIANTKLKNLQMIIQYARKKNFQIIPYEKYLDERYQSNIPGEHNRQNMATALAVIEALQLDVDQASRYLSKDFLGIKRRLEHIGYTKHGAKLYDDYAHNPEGIQLLLDGLRKRYPQKKIVMLFEPHLYSRTEDFKEAFGEVLSQIDILYLFPVYPAREKSQPEKDFLLKDYIHKEENFYIVKKPEIFKEIFEEEQYDENYIVVTVGAGNIWKYGLKILNKK